MQRDEIQKRKSYVRLILLSINRITEEVQYLYSSITIIQKRKCRPLINYSLIQRISLYNLNEYLGLLLFHRLSSDKVKNSFSGRHANESILGTESPKARMYNKIEPTVTDEMLERWTDSCVRAHVSTRNVPSHVSTHLSTQNVIAEIKETVFDDARDSALIEPHLPR